ncbi:VOC family protein [Bauldia sp.]|uniref:VOC family protein n=1 Tax=Bauldia sp. TaxID=2575872 RepID=UPI003BAD7727
MTTAKITEQAPILFVSDLPASVDYWRDKVGFTVGGIYGEPRPEFAILRRDRAFVMLSQAPDGHTIVPSWRIKDKTWNAYFWVDDAEAMFAELKERGARIDYELGRQPYDVLEFGIQDLDDQDIAFGQDLD